MPGVAAVTGATGFIGTHLVRHMADHGWRIRILARRIPGSHDFPLPPLEAVIGDLNDSSALDRLVAGADVVIHLAGLIKAPANEACQAANVHGTAAVVAAVTRHRVARLIHVSSLAAREPDLSDYARSKARAEDKVHRLPDGLNSTIIRPPIVYGPGDRETLAFFQSASRGFSIIPGTRDQRLSFININDLCELINLISQSGFSSAQPLEVDDGKPGAYGWLEIVSALSAAAGKHLRTVHMPAAAVRMAGGVNAAAHRLRGTTTMFTPGKVREVLHPDWAARPAAEAPPGWRPTCLIPEGFEKTMLWYRSKGWL